MKHSLLALTALIVAPFLLHGEDFLASHVATFWNGAEFPGASGSFSCTGNVLNLVYDFRKGGHYVSARFNLPERPVARAISLDANFKSDTELTLRVMDSSGQTFQYRLPGSPTGWERITVYPEENWASWGGANDHVIHQPLTEFSVLAENLLPDHPSSTGSLLIRNVTFSQQGRPRPDSGLPLPDVSFGDLIRRAGAARDELQRTVPALEARGLGAKSRATLSVLDDFFPWILEDVARGFTNRAVREARELAALGERGVTRARGILAGTVKDFPVPRYKTSPITISHAQMLADRVWPDGHTDHGPVMLTGFGHFSTIRRNLHQMPPLGCNLLQMEIGPNSFLRDEHTLDTNAVTAFTETAARAARENVAITLLLSPHYFPNWAHRKWPHLATCSGGFLGYCVYAPEARGVVEKFLRAIIPLVRGNPALHSICLSNEPETHVYADCPFLRREWPRWLARRHASIDAFNADMKTSFRSFEEVPLPKNFRDNPPSLLLGEFRSFNTEQFAAWHKWMADIIHDMAPEIPVHAKIMINPCLWNANATFYSVDPVAFGRLSQYNGNDSYCPYRSNQISWNANGWIHDWAHMESGYDFQRSTTDLPVFNTENHIHPDRSGGYLPGAHTYTVLWQNTIHGQSATTLWCWERAYDDGKSDFNGLILERPEALEAWAHCALDLSRLADVLAPIQNRPPVLLLLWSPAAILADNQNVNAFQTAYRAATFLGQSLGFATDDALTDFGRTGMRTRPLDSARVILLPEPLRVSPAVEAGLKRFADEGGKVLHVDIPNERLLAQHLARLAPTLGLPDDPVACDPATGLPAFGVETRGYRKDGRAWISLCNHLCKPVKVRLESPGVDLISGNAVPAEITVAPLCPLLVELTTRGGSSVSP